MRKAKKSSAAQLDQFQQAEGKDGDEERMRDNQANGAPADIDDVVATVDDTQITMGTIILMRANLPEQYQNIPDEQLYEGLVQQAVNQVLLARMGAASGDYDGDGDMDWFVSSINGNRLYQNTGGNFIFPTEAADVAPGGWGWGSCFADFNADGRLDIYQTNGWDVGADPANSPYVDDATRLWMANPDGSFADMATVSNMRDTEQGRGVICDDFDSDGDVDVLLLTLDDQQAARLWNNQLSDGNVLSVLLEGRAPNTFAVGALISATVGSETQTRLVGINSNFISRNSTRQYFGFDEATSIDTLRVTWPDGEVTEINTVDTNQALTIRHPDL